MFTRKISEKISFLIGFVGLLLFPVVINATSFTDNHNDNALTGWTTNGSRTWSEASGAAAPANGNANVGYLINNTAPSANGTLEVRMTADQWNGYKGGVVFRWSSTTSYYFVTVLPGNQYSSYIAFCKNSMDAATGTKVAQNFTMGTTFTLKIEMNAGTFKFYIDGTLRGQVTDNTLASGKIGYAHTNDWNRYTTYDNITWTDATPTSYTLTATTVGTGTVSPATGTYPSGTSVAVTATAGAGWHFSNWSGDASGTTNPLTVVMSANRAIVANFVQDTYTFSATTVGSGTVTPASGTYPAGTSVSVTATAVAGWHFDHWSGDATGSTNPLTVVMSANRAIVATFVQNTYTFAATTVGSGTVTPASGTYTAGTPVAVTATAATGWHFDHWSGDATGSTNPLTVVMSANRAVVANFAQNSYTLTTTTSGSGTVTPPSGSYPSGTSVIVTATAAVGWHFDHWTGGVTGTVNPITVEMISNLSIQAVFTENAAQYTLTSTVTGTGTVTPSNGSFPAGTSVSVTAAAGAGWHFDHWSGDVTGTTNPLTVVMSANRSIVANFVQNAYELSATTVGNGTVVPASGTYLSGASVIVTATAAAGWSFDHWSGDISGTTNPVTVVMSANRVFVAHFVQHSYTLSTTVTGSGTVSPASGIYLSGTPVVVTATAAVGWHFDSWGGDITGTTNPVTVAMSANRNINAIFMENTPVTPNSQKLSISSRLLSADGTPVGNDVAEERDITIRLYDQEVGGNLLFTETFLDANGQAAIVNRGYFVVRLGEGTTTGSLATVLAANSNIWVEITVGTATFLQRMPLTSAPYVIH
jgi:hypothetical protein